MSAVEHCVPSCGHHADMVELDELRAEIERLHRIIDNYVDARRAASNAGIVTQKAHDIQGTVDDPIHAAYLAAVAAMSADYTTRKYAR